MDASQPFAHLPAVWLLREPINFNKNRVNIPQTGYRARLMSCGRWPIDDD